jgi:hypothetical protein
VVEVSPDGNERGRGTFEFLSLPSAGDKFVIAGSTPALDIMTVLFVEHSPLNVPRNARMGEKQLPTATIYARETGEWDP